MGLMYLSIVGRLCICEVGGKLGCKACPPHFLSDSSSPSRALKSGSGNHTCEGIHAAGACPSTVGLAPTLLGLSAALYSGTDREWASSGAELV